MPGMVKTELVGEELVARIPVGRPNIAYLLSVIDYGALPGATIDIHSNMSTVVNAIQAESHPEFVGKMLIAPIVAHLHKYFGMSLEDISTVLADGTGQMTQTHSALETMVSGPNNLPKAGTGYGVREAFLAFMALTTDGHIFTEQNLLVAIRLFFAGWVECAVASSNEQVITTTATHYGPLLTDPNWVPDDSWKWWLKKPETKDA